MSAFSDLGETRCFATRRAGKMTNQNLLIVLSFNDLIGESRGAKLKTWIPD